MEIVPVGKNRVVTVQAFDTSSAKMEGVRLRAIVDVEKDKGLKNNIANEQKQITQKHLKFTQAFIQQYNNTIIENKTIVSK